MYIRSNISLSNFEDLDSHSADLIDPVLQGLLFFVLLIGSLAKGLVYYIEMLVWVVPPHYLLLHFLHQLFVLEHRPYINGCLLALIALVEIFV